MIHNFTPIPPGTWLVNGIGDTRVQALGHGDVTIDVTVNGVTRTGTIHDVLYVPELGVNLISMADVTELGLTVTFMDTRVIISLNTNTQMVGKRTGKTLPVQHQRSLSSKQPATL